MRELNKRKTEVVDDLYSVIHLESVFCWLNVVSIIYFLLSFFSKIFYIHICT